MTLNDLQTKVKTIHFGTNRCLTYDLLSSRMHRLATL